MFHPSGRHMTLTEVYPKEEDIIAAFEYSLTTWISAITGYDGSRPKLKLANQRIRRNKLTIPLMYHTEFTVVDDPKFADVDEAFRNANGIRCGMCDDYRAYLIRKRPMPVNMTAHGGGPSEMRGLTCCLKCYKDNGYDWALAGGQGGTS